MKKKLSEYFVAFFHETRIRWFVIRENGFEMLTSIVETTNGVTGNAFYVSLMHSRTTYVVPMERG